MRIKRFVAVLLVCHSKLLCQTAPAGLSGSAYDFLAKRTLENGSTFAVWKGWDSAFNKGYPSGRFGLPDFATLAKLNLGCVYKASSPTGCGGGTDYDPDGTVIQVTYRQMFQDQFAGFFFQEPEAISSPLDRGWDLSRFSALVLEAASPTGGVSSTFSIGPEGAAQTTRDSSLVWQEYRLPLPTLRRDVNNLFAASTDYTFGPRSGGVLLLRNVRYEPDTPSAQFAPSLPLSYRTMGVTPVPVIGSGRVRVPIDQVLANLAGTSDVCLTLIALLHDPRSVAAARQIADSLVVALSHDNHGLAIPTAPDGSRGLRNAYMGGDLLLRNDQPPLPGHAPRSRGLRDDVRLPGFTVGEEETECGEAKFCLVLNGASGGNNAMAILALVAASHQLEADLAPVNRTYLNTAREIAGWIQGTLFDTENFGGYFLGYPDEGLAPSALRKGKSTADNAEIFAAFRSLSAELRTIAPAESQLWQSRAEQAATFVESMFDPSTGSFFSGTARISELNTVPFGVIPDGPSKGADVINIYDYLDAQTIPILALAAGGRSKVRPKDFQTALDWLEPMKRDLVLSSGQALKGYNYVTRPLSDSPDGIAWLSTAQVILAMRRADAFTPTTPRRTKEIATYLEQLRLAQTIVPFADGTGIPASTLDRTANVYEQCVSVPYACIPARLATGATAWAIFAENNFSPFDLP